MAVVQREILTIGYEGAGTGELIAARRAARVATLVDVRDEPWSRRHEFAKRPLSEALARAGLAEVAWRLPPASGYYQPVVTARKPA